VNPRKWFKRDRKTVDVGLPKDDVIEVTEPAGSEWHVEWRQLGENVGYWGFIVTPLTPATRDDLTADECLRSGLEYAKAIYASQLNPFPSHIPPNPYLRGEHRRG
jgi:hypothetical protein